MRETEIYTKALEILDAPEKWTKYAMARDATGKQLWANAFKDLPPLREEAFCFCLAGALTKAVGRKLNSDDLPILKDYLCIKNAAWIPDFNDAAITEYKDVIKVLEDVLEKSKEADAKLV
jgi:hypothetical protein